MRGQWFVTIDTLPGQWFITIDTMLVQSQVTIDNHAGEGLSIGALIEGSLRMAMSLSIPQYMMSGGAEFNI